MSSSNSPCAACKCLRRKCTQECAYAPYFPPSNPQKFINVHKVFGASNVAKILNELSASQREDAVNSLAYEAECRLRDPVYGCVGLISILQHKLKQVQHDLENAKKELATYIGPAAMLPELNHPGFVNQQHMNYGPSAYQAVPYNIQSMNALPHGVPHGAQPTIQDHHHQLQQHQQQHFLEAQQMAAVATTYEQQQQQQSDLVRFNSGLDDAATVARFNQMHVAGGVQSSLALHSSQETLTYNHLSDVPEQSDSRHLHQLQLRAHGILLQEPTVASLQQQQQQKLALPQASQSQRQLTKAKSEDRSINP